MIVNIPMKHRDTEFKMSWGILIVASENLSRSRVFASFGKCVVLRNAWSHTNGLAHSPMDGCNWGYRLALRSIASFERGNLLLKLRATSLSFPFCY
jgi:hypothetical protein